MKNISLILILFLSCLQAFSQSKKDFPALKAKRINGQEVNLPSDTKGKMTLVGLAFSAKAENDLTTWFQPIYTNFIEEGGGGLFPEESYDINSYFIPMFSGINKAATDKFVKHVKEQVDPELQDHILIYSGESKSIKEQLNLGAKDEPYFFLLDDTGKIVYRTSGAYSEKKLEDIFKELDKE